MPTLIIGSRGSKLALWQANWVKAELERLYPAITVAIEIIKTTGDKLAEASLVKIGGKGVFTKEIEEALLDHRIDVAVHSLKDLPTRLPEGLHLCAITEREDARDALVVGPHLQGRVNSISQLPAGARVGTSSLRRAAQLRHLRPDLQLLELRGNVETRLRKLDQGAYDAIILASAGLLRLGFGERITERIDPELLLPAPGQGALGLETRIEDERTNFLLEVLNHWPTRNATEAERAVLCGLGGGCAVPLAAYGYVEGDEQSGQLVLKALIADAAGDQIIRDQVTGPQYKGDELGWLLARRLLAAGAHQLLARTGAPQSSASPAPVTPLPAELESERAVAFGQKFTSGEGEGVEPLSATPALPLSGRRVIVTRASKQAGELIRLLEISGAEVIACPTIEIREPESWAALDDAIANLKRYDWIVFTSSNGVDFFLRRMDELGRGRAELIPYRVCAVGRKTAERLSREGIHVDLTPARFTAESVVEAFIKRYGVGQRLRGTRMLLPASSRTRDVIRPALDKFGIQVDVVTAYQTVIPATSSEDVIKLISQARADYIIFTSPSTVANLATLLETDNLESYLAGTRVACIGPVTAEAARVQGLKVHLQPEEHTAQAIVKLLIKDNAP
jgi:hydroxymethylbilane synthase